jgi:uncharacterized membrane protein
MLQLCATTLNVTEIATLKESKLLMTDADLFFSGFTPGGGVY